MLHQWMRPAPTCIRALVVWSISLSFLPASTRAAQLEWSLRQSRTYLDYQYSPLVVADVDGDGYDDLVLSHGPQASAPPDRGLEWLKYNEGTRFFDPPIHIGAPRTCTGIAVGDLDSDMDLDVLCHQRNEGASNLQWYKNDNPLTHNPWERNSVGNGSRNLQEFVAVDMDVSGFVDILAIHPIENSVVWFKNLDRTGNAWDRYVIFSPSGMDAGVLNLLVAVDMNNDSYIDVISQTITPYTIRLHWNGPGLRGNWEFDEIFQDANVPIEGMAAADLDGDSDFDVVLLERRTDLGYDAAVVVWYENRDGQGKIFERRVIFQDVDPIGALGEPSITVVDVDNDGSLDVVVTLTRGSSMPHQTLWFENLGNGNFASESQLIAEHAVNDAPMTLATGDFDRDGYPEVVTFGGGNLAIFESTLPTPMVTESPTQMPTPTPVPTTEIPILTLVPSEMPAPMPTFVQTTAGSTVETEPPPPLCPPLRPNLAVLTEDTRAQCARGAQSGDLCKFTCGNDTHPAVQFGGSDRFVCRDDGTWSPDPFAAALVCLPMCPTVPDNASIGFLRSPCENMWSGRVCSLSCAAGYFPNVIDTTTRSTGISVLRCGRDGSWLVDYTDGQVYYNSSQELLTCSELVCSSLSAGFAIHGLPVDCNFNELNFTYRFEVPYEQEVWISALAGNVAVSFAADMQVLNSSTPSVSQQTEPLDLVVGENVIEVEAGGNRYTFVIVRLPPLTISTLASLGILNVNLSAEFDPNVTSYDALVPVWRSRILVLHVATSEHTTTEVFVNDLTHENQDSAMELNSGPNTIEVLVTAQDGASRTRYEIQVDRTTPQTCNEQDVCVAFELAGCDDLCSRSDAEEGEIGIDWPVTVAVASACAVLWVLTTVSLKLSFDSFGVFNPFTIALWTSVYDAVNDLLFVGLLFDEQLYTEAIVVVVFVVVGALGNSCAMTYVVRREVKHNREFASWYGERVTITGAIALLCLSNAQALGVLSVGAELTTKPETSSSKTPWYKKSFCLAARMRSYFSAPMPQECLDSLRKSAWLGFLLDDVAILGVQLYVTFGINTEAAGPVLFALTAGNAYSTVARFTMLTCHCLAITARKNAKLREMPGNATEVQLATNEGIMTPENKVGSGTAENTVSVEGIRTIEGKVSIDSSGSRESSAAKKAIATTESELSAEK